MMITHNHKNLRLQPIAPLGSHPQAFNLLPWRAQFMRYRWQKLCRWLWGLVALLGLWTAGLYLLNTFYHQHLSTNQRLLHNAEQQALAKSQQAQRQKSTAIGQHWRLKQAGIKAWQQTMQEQNWLEAALHTMQHHAATIDGHVRTWRLQPDEGEFSLLTSQPWHQVDQALVLPTPLRITSVRSATTGTGMYIDIHSADD